MPLTPLKTRQAHEKHPQTLSLSSIGYNSPHDPMLRAQYTVPSNKKAIVSGLHIQIIRTEQPTGLNVVRAWIDLPQGTVNYVVHWNLMDGTSFSAAPAAYIILNPSETVQFWSSDWSQGGIVWYVMIATIMEVDS